MFGSVSLGFSHFYSAVFAWNYSTGEKYDFHAPVPPHIQLPWTSNILSPQLLTDILHFMLKISRVHFLKQDLSTGFLLAAVYYLFFFQTRI